MGALAAVHLTADHALGVLHGNPAHTAVHKHNAYNNQQHAHDHERDEPRRDGLGDHRLDAGEDLAGEAGDDTDKDQQRHAVADAVFRDALADPHGKGSTGRQHHKDQSVIKEVGVCALCHRAGAQAQDDTQRHDAAQSNGHHTGDLRDLLAAFLAFLLETLQRGNGDGQQLHDDRGGDVGRNTHRKDGEVREVLTVNEVEHTQHGDVVDLLCNVIDVNAGRRDHRADAVDEKHDQRVDDLLAEILHLPSIAESFKHVRSPLLSHHLPRFFLLRSWRTSPP